MSTEHDFYAVLPVRPLAPPPKGNYAAFIVHRKGTPQEWHQFVDRRDSEFQAEFAVRCALDMSGACFGYVQRDGITVCYYGPSRSGRSVSLWVVEAGREPQGWVRFWRHRYSTDS
jgi:hypothetical protein